MTSPPVVRIRFVGSCGVTLGDVVRRDAICGRSVLERRRYPADLLGLLRGL